MTFLNPADEHRKLKSRVTTVSSVTFQRQRNEVIDIVSKIHSDKIIPLCFSIVPFVSRTSFELRAKLPDPFVADWEYVRKHGVCYF